MKKLLTALIAFVMCFSVVTTAFAATPDEASDPDLISDIKQAMLDTYYGDEKPDFIEVRIYGTASDGGVYFDFMDSFTHWTDEVEFDIGDYTVSYPRDCPVLLYKNNKVYTLSDAYETGVIDDDMLYELYVWGNLWGKIDVTPKGEDRALLSEIKRVIINKYYNGKAPEYLNVEIVGSTSDETVCFRNIPFMSLGVMIEQTIGDYTYYYNHGDDVMLYKNGNVYSIKEAYESGVIDDSILEELSKMNFGLESNKPNTTVPTEPTTSVATVDEPVTVPDTTSATSATKPVSTSDAYINYMMNHQSEWMPSLGSNHNLSGVMFLDFDFDGVPELVAQKADSNEYSFHSVVYKFEDGKLKRVGNVNDGFAIYYNKTAKKYEVHDLKISLNVDDGYYWSGNSIITYDGENLFANMYSARGVGEESNNNIYYRYFDGNDKNISRAKYNEINLKQFNNCVNAHMFTKFIVTGYGDNSVWSENTTAENKQSLLDAYNSFSYEKY